MSGQASLAVITSILGLLTAGILALVNSWISARAGLDENLRSQRLEVYPTLWGATEVVSYLPRDEITRGGLEELHRALRSWYYTKGRLFISELARARYGDVQKLTAAMLAHNGDSADVLVPDRYRRDEPTVTRQRPPRTESSQLDARDKSRDSGADRDGRCDDRRPVGLYFCLSGEPGCRSRAAWGSAIPRRPRLALLSRTMLTVALPTLICLLSSRPVGSSPGSRTDFR